MSDHSVTRRRVLAGAVGAGVAAAAVRIGLAQDEAATPEADPGSEGAATPDASPAAGVGGETTDDAVSEAAEAIEAATAAITAAQADRDAVADRTDPRVPDRLIAQAAGLRDRAQTAADAGDDEEAFRSARAAIATARAASELVEAQLIDAGLPSQEAPASRVLAGAHEAIQAATDDAGDTADADATASITTAQELYRTAYDLYGAGAYSQAAATARVAAELAWIGQALASPDARFGPGRGPGRGRRGRGGDFGRGRGPGRGDGPGRGLDPGTDEPVPVPEPGF